ncbi:MAG: multidrug effflux MFS transporter [Legionella sp.]|nr:multidrug effflux MFS transporter [Legionella sp.]
MSHLDTKEQFSAIPLFLLVLILLLATLMQMTTDLYLPSLPAITKTFNSNDATIKLTLSIFMLGLSLSNLIYGPLSDRFGRKPPILIGVGISALGSLLCFLAPSATVLILGRFLQGIGIGCCNSVGRSLIRDLLTDTLLAKIGSYVGMVSVFIMALSPTLGGYVQHYMGWRANFLLLLLFALVIWFLMYFRLPETNKHRNPEATKLKIMGANYRILLQSKIFMGYTLCACFGCAGLVAYLTVGPFLIQDMLGFTAVEFGWMSFFLAGAIFFSGLINSQLVVKKGISFMLMIGIFLMIGGGLIMLVLVLSGFITMLAIMIPVAIFSMGAGFTFINAFAGAFHPFPKMAGTTGALYAFLQDLSAACASALMAYMKGSNQFPLAIVFTFLGIGSLCAWRYLAVAEGRNNTDNLHTM